MRRDNRGISRIVEFVIMFTVFIVIVTAFYSLANIWLRAPIVDYNQEEAMRISEVLINNPGSMDNNNSKINWEDYPAYYNDAPDIDTNMISLGFAKDKSSYGVLSMSKIFGMGKITYPKARTLLGLSAGKNFNITIESINNTKIIGNETKIYWGADYTSAKNVGMYKRIVLIYDSMDNETPYKSARLTICLFDGGVYDEKIVINEIMYAPPGDDEPNEWIELYNPTSMAIDVDEWRIGNKNPDPEGTTWGRLKSIDSDKEIGLRGSIIVSNGFAVIPSTVSNVKKNFTYNPDGVWLRQLDESGTTVSRIAGRLLEDLDTLILKNRYWDTVDEVNYTGVSGSKDTNESLERISPLDDSWYNSSTGFKGGTLGRRNSISDFSNPNLGNLISVGPGRYDTGASYVLYNITVMNNGNITDTITISNISELGWNVSITVLEGGINYTYKDDGTIEANLSAINLCTNVNETYLRLEVNVTIPTGISSGTQNIAIIIAVSEKYSIAYNYTVFDTVSILTKVS